MGAPDPRPPLPPIHERENAVLCRLCHGSGATSGRCAVCQKGLCPWEVRGWNGCGGTRTPREVRSSAGAGVRRRRSARGDTGSCGGWAVRVQPGSGVRRVAGSGHPRRLGPRPSARVGFHGHGRTRARSRPARHRAPVTEGGGRWGGGQRFHGTAAVGRWHAGAGLVVARR